MRHIMNIGRSAQGVVAEQRSDGDQLGTDVTELGAGSGQLDTNVTELGAGNGQLGTDVTELGAGNGQLGTDVTELGAGSGWLGTISGDLGAACDDLAEEDDGEFPKYPCEIYFTKNWDSCRSMWCAFERQNAVTMGNNTNNRIEASRKQLKDLVNSFMGVDECVVSIMFYQDQEKRKFVDCLYKLSVVHNPKYDRKMRFLSNLVSEHACELIYDQYIFAITRAKYKYYEPVPNVFLLQHDCDEEDAIDEPRCKYSVT
ncbi:hypothetical protein PF007_g2497 [Phytophthora fragariae]|uniref:Uncharacterized protein n=2 Tax=Phytophthora fragariae TaxID=53985 RepID=A0A6A3TFR7_9STRA|nr:hypothetical protein PF007_g2497 [Phytophthora fragariae]KAE9304390.1 hypothetical protein PF001_g13104 [Phytophthora fragariae]